MQKITESMLKAQACRLLKEGAVTRVLGWRRGAFSYDVTPAVFEDAASLERDFVYDIFCCANLSKYLIRETQKPGKTLIFLKSCDGYAFNRLLTEHRFDRERVYAIGIPCGGKMDVPTVTSLAPDGLTGAEQQDETLLLHTLYDGDACYPLADVLPERCCTCGHGMPAACDEQIGDIPASVAADVTGERFDAARRLEQMTEEERFAFWQGEFSRCIRCNACRDVCPVCTCEQCVFDNPASGLENKAAADSFEEKLFHIIRAYHVTGRCTDCGECSRVCPQRIPLHLLNRKMILDINRSYGAYTSGAEVGQRSPLVDYRTDDPEAAVGSEGSDGK